MQDYDTQNNEPNTPNNPAPMPEDSNSIYPPGSGEPPVPPVDMQNDDKMFSDKPRKNFGPILRAIILMVLAFAACAFFFYHQKSNEFRANELTNFEKKIKNLGYSSDDRTVGQSGAYATYSLLDEDLKIWGLAHFYEMSSVEELRNFISRIDNEDPELANKYFNSLNWSLNYEKKEDCSDESEDIKVCKYVIHKSNTLLMLFITSHSTEDSKKEAERVLSALDY